MRTRTVKGGNPPSPGAPAPSRLVEQTVLLSRKEVSNLFHLPLIGSLRLFDPYDPVAAVRFKTTS